MKILDKIRNGYFYVTNPTLLPLRSKGFSPERYISLTKPWVQKLQINSILDIGANTGQAALVFRKAFPNAQVYSFEPLPDCFQELEANTSHFTNFKAFNIGLGEVKGTVEFKQNIYSPSSSMLPMTDKHHQNFPFTKGSRIVTVKVERLDSIASNIRLVDNTLIKLDVQGFERQVIAGGHDVFSRAKMLIVETSFDTLYEGQPLFDEIYGLLKRLGFRYEGSFEQLVSPVDERVLQQDAIFIRQ